MSRRSQREGRPPREVNTGTFRSRSPRRGITAFEALVAFGNSDDASDLVKSKAAWMAWGAVQQGLTASAMTTIVFNRFPALGFLTVQDVVGHNPDEFMARWSSECGQLDEHATPGAARARAVEVFNLCCRLMDQVLGQTHEAITAPDTLALLPGADTGSLARPAGALESSLAVLAETLRMAVGGRSAPKTDFPAHGEDTRDDRPPFALASFLQDYASQPGDMARFDTAWFADLKRLSGLAQEAEKARHRRTFAVAESTFDRWPPQWVGASKFIHERLAAVRKRESEILTGGLARILGNVAVYWLSHAAAGEVSIPAVLGHLLCLVRLADEKTVAFAVKYEMSLHTKLIDQVRSGTLGLLDSATMNLDPAHMNELNIEFAREPIRRQDDHRARDGPRQRSPQRSRRRSPRGRGGAAFREVRDLGPSEGESADLRPG